MTQTRFSTSQIATTLGVIFVGGILLSLGLAIGNHLSNWPTWTQAVNLLTSEQNSLFHAQGEAILTVVPDQAVINLGIEVTASTVKAAQDGVNNIIGQLQADLSALGIENKNIKTRDYSLWPNYDWNGGDKRITGYSANSTVIVTLNDFELLNRVIDTATNDGINEINGVNFTLSEAKKTELHKQARQEAIKQARQNAQELADLTGITLGKIVNVEESQGNSAVMKMSNMVMRDSAVEEAGGFATSLEAGETTYSYHVTLSYQTL